MFDKLCTKLLTTAKATITGVTSLFAKLCTCSHAVIGYWLLKANYPGDLQQELLSSSKFSGSWKEKLQRKLSLWVSTHKERKTLQQVGTGSSEMLHARTGYQLNTPVKRRITVSWIPVNKKIKDQLDDFEVQRPERQLSLFVIRLLRHSSATKFPLYETDLRTCVKLKSSPIAQC